MEKRYTIAFRKDREKCESGCVTCHLDRSHCCYVCDGKGMFIIKEIDNGIQKDIS